MICLLTENFTSIFTYLLFWFIQHMLIISFVRLEKITSQEEFIEMEDMKLKGEIVFIIVIACILNIISLR
jgi:hypothetical protein